MEMIRYSLHVITSQAKAKILIEATFSEASINKITFWTSTDEFLSLYSPREDVNSDPSIVLVDGDSPENLSNDLDVLRNHTENDGSLVILFSISQLDENTVIAKGADFALQLPFTADDLFDKADGMISEMACTMEEVILFIDDSQLIHKMIDTILTPQGYRVEHAFDGDEGILRAEQLLPDLIITDIEMPNKDGYEVCRYIKANEKFCEIPVLIQSSLNDGLHIDKGFEAGADDYITKPINPTELVSRINSFLSPAPQGRETILVADSSKLITNMIVTGLKKQGFKCLTASTGPEILERAQNDSIDLFIISQVLPVMEGREVVRTLRKDPSTKSSPVIMLSSRDSKLDLIKSRSAGVSEFISKPFGVERLLVAVEKLLAEFRFVKERDAMSLYLSETAMDHAGQLAKSKAPLTMRAEEEFRTILFTDIVGFTPLCESLAPDKVISLLNNYFDLLVDIIRNNGGTIDKFIGDAVMAVYGGRENGAFMAVKSGLEMIKALEEFNQSTETPLHIRVGINSGQVVMGDLGSKFFRRDYTLIGDAVNVAQRLEGAAPQDRVLVSDSTWSLVEGHYTAHSLDPIPLKGKAGLVHTYLIEGEI